MPVLSSLQFYLGSFSRTPSELVKRVSPGGKNRKAAGPRADHVPMRIYFRLLCLAPPALLALSLIPAFATDCTPRARALYRFSPLSRWSCFLPAYLYLFCPTAKPWRKLLHLGGRGSLLVSGLPLAACKMIMKESLRPMIHDGL